MKKTTASSTSTVVVAARTSLLSNRFVNRLCKSNRCKNSGYPSLFCQPASDELSSFDGHDRTTRRGNQNCVINRFMVRGTLFFTLPTLFLTIDQATLTK